MKWNADKSKTAGGWRGALARLDADEAKADRDWRIRFKSMDGNARLLAAVEGKAAQSSDDADGGGMMDALRSLLAFVLALPMPRRVIVIEWLAAGRNITRAMVRDYHRSHAQLKAEIAASGVAPFLADLSEVQQ